MDQHVVPDHRKGDYLHFLMNRCNCDCEPNSSSRKKLLTCFADQSHVFVITKKLIFSGCFIPYDKPTGPPQSPTNNGTIMYIERFKEKLEVFGMFFRANTTSSGVCPITQSQYDREQYTYWCLIILYRIPEFKRPCWVAVDK